MAIRWLCFHAREMGGAIVPGCWVLIERNRERFWCFVEKANVCAKGITRLTVVVDNLLIHNPSLRPGSRLDGLLLCDVLDVLTPEDHELFQRAADEAGNPFRAASAWWRERKRKGGKAAGAV